MKVYLTILSFCLFIKVTAQVGIGTTTPASSATLDIVSNNSGVLIPRMTTTERLAIATPANALLVFDNTTTTFWYYDLANTQWIEMALGGGNPLVDADGDTKVDVEETVDEDIIRFDLAGQEIFRLSKTVNGITLFENPGSGTNSTVFGENSGKNITTGQYNTFFGKNTGSQTTTGAFNTLIGGVNGSANTTGSNNTFVGYATGLSNVIGEKNTYIGQGAGLNSLGDNNVFIGHFAGANEVGDNKLYIESSGSNTPLIYGDFANDNLTINGALEVFTNINNSGISLRTSDNSFSHGVGFQNSGGWYTWNMYKTINANSGEPDLRFASGPEELTNLTDRVTFSNTGRVGIRTSNPRADLEIKQSNVTTGGTGGIKFTHPNDDDNTWRIYNSFNSFSFNRDNTRRSYINLTGSYITLSDKRLKKKVSTLKNVLPNVLKLNPVKYLYNHQKDNDQPTLGFIAQEVLPLFPELVHNDGNDEYYGMSYSNTGAIAIKAIQELNVIIEKQQEQINYLMKVIEDNKK